MHYHPVQHASEAGQFFQEESILSLDQALLKWTLKGYIFSFIFQVMLTRQKACNNEEALMNLPAPDSGVNRAWLRQQNVLILIRTDKLWVCLFFPSLPPSLSIPDPVFRLVIAQFAKGGDYLGISWSHDTGTQSKADSLHGTKRSARNTEATGFKWWHGNCLRKREGEMLADLSRIPAALDFGGPYWRLSFERENLHHILPGAAFLKWWARDHLRTSTHFLVGLSTVAHPLMRQ